MKNIRIFISSSERELEHERETASEIIEGLNLDPVLFELQGAFSRSPFEAFLNEVSQSDIFVMILWKSLSPAVLQEYKRAISLHKPILIFVKNLLHGEKASTELSEFLNQFSFSEQMTVTPQIKVSGYTHFRALKELKTQLKKSILSEISKFYREPTTTLSREEMYDLGTDIIRHAQKRVAIFQRTPTLFLGMKDRYRQKASYTAGSYSTFEKRFNDTLEQWINNKYKSGDVEFIYLYDSELTRQEVVKYIFDSPDKTQKLAEIKSKIEKYKEIERESNYMFRFTPIETPISGPLCIGDNRYAIWILGSDDAISFSQEDEKIASILVRMIRTQNKKAKPADEIFNFISAQDK